MLNFAEFEQVVALHVARDMVETNERRRRLGYIKDVAARQEFVRIWVAYEEAYPPAPGWVRPNPDEVTREQAQIEKIAASIWETFHARHGGEFAPSGSIAATVTMALADRTWAIAQAPEPMTLPLMSALMEDLDAHARAGRWDYLSEVYGALNPTRMSVEEMVVYLRTLYAGRGRITTYRDLLARCKAALERRGALKENTLRGLD